MLQNLPTGISKVESKKSRFSFRVDTGASRSFKSGGILQSSFQRIVFLPQFRIDYLEKQSQSDIAALPHTTGKR
jgi:hypothetical protein